MLQERIEGKWIDAFAKVFTHCDVKPGDPVAIFSETQSRPINVHLAELALLRLGAIRPELEGRWRVRTAGGAVEVTTVYELLRKRLEGYTPELADAGTDSSSRFTEVSMCN